MIFSNGLVLNATLLEQHCSSDPMPTQTSILLSPYPSVIIIPLNTLFVNLFFCIKNCFRQPCSSSKYSKTVYAIPCDSTYGTPFPIVLNILVKVMSEGRENDAGNVCIANASATYNLLAWYGCRYTSLFPYATVDEYRQRWSRL